MKISSYDPYHIGIKLTPALSFQIFREKLLRSMNDAGMNVVINDLIPNVPQEVVFREENARIEFNYASIALNTIGNNPKDATELFKKLVNILTTMGYDVNGLAVLFEILSNINVTVDTDPNPLITNSVKCNLDEWREINNNISVNGLKIEATDEVYGKETLRILIGPNTIRPNTLLLNINYRSVDVEKIVNFGNSLDKRVMSIVTSLGG